MAGQHYPYIDVVFCAIVAGAVVWILPDAQASVDATGDHSGGNLSISTQGKLGAMIAIWLLTIVSLHVFRKHHGQLAEAHVRDAVNNGPPAPSQPRRDGE